MSNKSPVLPWSYSSLNAFETCPKRYYLTIVSKQVKEPQTEATLHGNEVHKALELAIKGDQQLVPKYKQYAPIVERVRARDGKRLVEHKFGLTSSFKPTTFFAKDVWVRGVIDFLLAGEKTAVALDWKTGKVKTDGDQMKLFAGAAFASFPWIERVKVGYVWLANDKVTPGEYTRDDIPEIWDTFLPRVQRMETAAKADRWLPNPSGLCRAFCPVGRRLCDFCGKD